MGDLLGVRAWRQKPLGERLMPWWVYAALALTSAALGLYMLFGTDDSQQNNVSVLFLVMATVHAYLTVLSRRVR